MLGNVLVPLDGTPLAEAALPFATAIATRTGASLILLRSARYSSLLADTDVDQYDVITDAEEYLSQVSERLTSTGIHVTSGVPFGGSPADWIVEESDIRDVDLIVMATHDREGPDRWLHGSVAESVVHRSKKPVMLVRTTQSAPLATHLAQEQPVIVVPLDGGELSEAALPFAQELAQALNARLVLLGVVPKPGQLVAGQAGAITTYSGHEHAVLEAEAHSYLAHIGEHLPNADTVVGFGDAACEIAALAEAYSAAAVIMATHGRTGMMRAVLGSVAGGVLHHTPIPLVLVHPAAVSSAV